MANPKKTEAKPAAGDKPRKPKRKAAPVGVRSWLRGMAVEYRPPTEAQLVAAARKRRTRRR